MSAKTKSERLKRLVSHGYFAPELPPCFVSDKLARYRNSILAGIDRLPQTQRREPSYFRFISEPSWFYFPRFGKEDRRHGVPNPIAHLLLSRVLADNYIDLRRKARESQITLSPPFFDWSGSRSLVRASIDLLDGFRVKLSSRREEYVVSDIRAFFHSIYTHAIPWAIHGKPFAKRNRGPGHYGNVIDLLCRNAQDGQTIGLPVGPDTSRLIAEVLASAVDVDLQQRLSIGGRDASRYVDDFTISSSERISGEEILAQLRQSTAYFELELNKEKSAVYSTAHRQIWGWQQAVMAQRPKVPRGQRVGADEVKHFLYQLGRTCDSHPDTNVEKYGLQIARSTLVSTDDWNSLQFSLINAYRRNSTLVPLLVEACLLRQATYGDVQVDDLSEFIGNRIPVLTRANRTGEIIWLLFLAVRLNISFLSQQLESLFQIENAFIALLVVCLDSRGLVQGNVDRNLWDQSLTTEGLRSPMWLYAYEAVLKGFVTNVDADFITRDAYFSLLWAKRIQFLDIARGYTSLSNTLNSLRSDNERRRLVIEAIEDFEFDELDDLDDLNEDEADDVDLY